VLGKALSRALAVLLFAPLSIAAQTPAPTAPVIGQITLDRRNIFDESESSIWITRFVNRLHVRTRAPLIRREFLFAVGEPYDSARVAETERNLRNLGVFRDVVIDTVRGDSGLTVAVTTSDGWSTRADFRFRSTGGSVAYTLAMIEDNLLGTLTRTEVLYRKDPDRTTTVFGFGRRRLIAGRVGASLTYANRSDGDLFTAVLSQPYFSLSSRVGASIAVDARRERVLRFYEGMETPTDTLQRRYNLVRADFGRALKASPAGYLRVGAVAQLRRDDFATQAAFDVQGADRTVSAAAGVYAEVRRAKFIKVRGYQSFGRREDVDLSDVVRISLLAAPSAFGYRRDGIAPGISAHTGLQFKGGFATADFVASGLFTSAGLDSGQVVIGGTAVLLPSPRHHVVIHAEAGALSRPVPGSEFDLGLGVGPRAFREHAFTGDRAFSISAEHRFTVSQDFLRLTGVGVATFVDHGGAWWQGAQRRSGWDAGIGLRLGPSRAPDQEATRIDLARRFGNDRESGGWVIVVGKGFTFSTATRSSR